MRKITSSGAHLILQHVNFGSDFFHPTNFRLRLPPDKLLPLGTTFIHNVSEISRSTSRSTGISGTASVGSRPEKKLLGLLHNARFSNSKIDECQCDVA